MASPSLQTPSHRVGAAPSPGLGLGRASFILRVGLALQCSVAAWIAWWYPTPINGFLFMHSSVGEEIVTLIDRGLSCLLAVLALAIIGVPRWINLIPAALIFLVWAGAEAWTHSDHVGRMSIPAHAVRYVAPIALLCLGSSKQWGGRAGEWLLRIGVAITFATHGWEALQQHPPFIDLMLGSANRFELTESLGLDEARAREALTVIGWVDITLAASVLILRLRAFALWMALWGLATAAGRWFELGDDGMFSALIRVMNGFAPLALFFLWQPSRPRPESRD